MSLRKIIATLLICTIVSFAFFVVKNTKASDQSTVGATIRISVCGDLVIEYPEDCEGTDLNGKSCTDLGYMAGDLLCDVACTFDTYGCIPYPSPTPTPTVMPTPTPTAVPAQEQESTVQTPATTSEIVPVTPTPTMTQIDLGRQIIERLIPCLVPVEVLFFSLDGRCSLPIEQIGQIVNNWADQIVIRPLELRACDLNRDGFCDLVDFSILMYYIK